MFWIIFCIILSALCLLEALLLIWDKGTIAQLITSARNLAAAQGWRAVIAPAFSFILGQMRDLKGNFFQSRQFSDNAVHIAFCPTGGLGDYIICAKVLEEIQKISEVKIDVFCEKEAFGRAIYGSRENVALKQYKKFEKKRNGYDLALLVEHFIHIKNYDKKRLLELSPLLYQKVKYILDNWDRLYVDIPQLCWRERIHFERCRILGLDRWSELQMGDAFIIADKKVRIPMDETYLTKWEENGYADKKYITINYGTDVMRAGCKQLKMWPKEYYEELIKLIHEKLPDIKAVQLGDKDAEMIRGCDKYVFGESMEQTKWILKKSLTHIDCEGGLVHLATQLGTKCIVIFGPTPLHMYGYEENINLQSVQCNNCMGLHNNWAYSCFCGTDGACMQEIKAQEVFEKIRKIYQESL